jgi:hypothetical protein
VLQAGQDTSVMPVFFCTANSATHGAGHEGSHRNVTRYGAGQFYEAQPNYKQNGIFLQSYT